MHAGSGSNESALPAVGRAYCWGEVLWDVFPDRKLLGGAPANVAYHLAALGSPVGLISRIGKDEPGEEALLRLRAAGVDTSLVGIDPERPTGRVDVVLHDGEPSYSLVPGCAWERIAVTPEAKAALPSAGGFCFGTLSQRLGHEELDRALALIPESCVVICDPNLRPSHVDTDLVVRAFRAADIVKINENEARLIGERVGVKDTIEWLLGELEVTLVALTRGVNGSKLIRRDQTSEHPGFKAQPGGDNIGAGDAFTAVLLHLTLKKAPLDLVNRAANRYAAFVASCSGATPALPADLIAEVNSLS